MNGNTYLLIIFTFFIAFAIAYLWYRYSGVEGRLFKILFIFRGLALWALAILLINPVFKEYEVYTEKPSLNILVDNSSSMGYLADPEKVQQAIGELRAQEILEEKFQVNWYAFGDELEVLDTLPAFDAPQTNIARALQRLKNLQGANRNLTFLITDGNSTYGGDYQFNTAAVSGPVYPLVVGDTTRFEDLYLERINVNRYAYLGNKFPVEIFPGYEGNRSVNARLEVLQNNRSVYREEITLNPELAGFPVRVELQAGTIGVNTYEVRITGLEDEKNTDNNKTSFAVEVIDERNKIAILANTLHPDLGSIKNGIESSGQRKADILKPADLDSPDSYDLFILYQPDRSFSEVFRLLNTDKKNFWLIGGEGTDWEFVNASQNLFEREVTYTTELMFGEVNANYSSYQFDDPGIAAYPPLDSYLGDFIIINPYEVLLGKNIGGVSTNAPLLFTTESSDQRAAILDGNNLWKWRLWHYALNENFESYDTFWSKLVQYLASGRRKERLYLEYEPYFYANSGIRFSAGYYDKNYSFDPDENVLLEIRQSDNTKIRTIAMVPGDNTYQAELNDLPAGDYRVQVTVPSQNLSRSGEFTVLGYEVERQFLNTDTERMNNLALATGGKMMPLNEVAALVSELSESRELTPVQKRKENIVPLLEWQWLLFLTAIFFALEWFTRKYNGLI